MSVPINYVQWKSRIKRYIDTKPNHELIHYCFKNSPYKLAWADKEVSISEGSPVTRTERYKETYKNVSKDIQDQLNAEAEAVQIILTGIDNDIYSTSQELKTVSYHKLYDILRQHQNEVHEIIAERIARTANPLALVAQQQPIYHPQNHPTHYTQNSLTRSQQAATTNRGKAIVNSTQPIYDQEPSMVAKDDEIANQDNSPRINRSTGYENQRIGNVAGAMETVGSTVVMDAPTLLVFAEKNPEDPIDIRVDIVHPTPADVFPTTTVVRTLAQHGKAIRGIHGHLEGVPINEEMNALRFRMGMVEEENASLRGSIKTMEAIDTITRRQEKRARKELKRQLTSVQ
nr:hypothetical protein [Tanacetum cinerariifolium]